jgi:hypothetical protein
MEPTFLFRDEWIKKMQCVQNRILFSLKKVILPFATTWMDLADIMLSGISQAQKEIYCMISLICEI